VIPWPLCTLKRTHDMHSPHFYAPFIYSSLTFVSTEVVKSYIANLEKQVGGDAADDDMSTQEEDAAPSPEAAAAAAGEPSFPPLYESGEDFDKAGDLKGEASEAKSSGDWEAALEKYTAAVLAAPPSALLYANRATALLALGRPYAAERDCTEALKENPDSAKALRVRGKARKELGQWETALKDISASQTIDFDEGTVEDLKFLTEKHVEEEKKVAAERITAEDKLRKRAEEIKAAQEDAKREAAEAAAEAMGGMPGGMGEGMGGMPAGMGGMPGGGGMPDMSGMGGGPGGGMPPGMDMSGLMGMMADPEMREAVSIGEQLQLVLVFRVLLSHIILLLFFSSRCQTPRSKRHFKN
jgi:suppressor of tumorigenicity protein 13